MPPNPPDLTITYDTSRDDEWLIKPKNEPERVVPDDGDICGVNNGYTFMLKIDGNYLNEPTFYYFIQDSFDQGEHLTDPDGVSVKDNDILFPDREYRSHVLGSGRDQLCLGRIECRLGIPHGVGGGKILKGKLYGSGGYNPDEK